MQDLTDYSELELSLLVYNDEGLYRMRRHILRDPSLLNDMFKYTDDQLKVLISDLKEDLEGE